MKNVSDMDELYSGDEAKDLLPLIGWLFLLPIAIFGIGYFQNSIDKGFQWGLLSCFVCWPLALLVSIKAYLKNKAATTKK